MIILDWTYVWPVIALVTATPPPPCVLRTALLWHCVLRTAIYLALRTAYRHFLASRTAYRLTQNNHFGRFHLHQDNNITESCMHTYNHS